MSTCIENLQRYYMKHFIIMDAQFYRPVTLLKGSVNPSITLCSLHQINSISLSFKHNISDQNLASTLTGPDVVD